MVEVIAPGSKEEKISKLLLQIELLTNHAKNSVGDDSILDFILGKVLEKVQEIQDLGGYKPLEF